MSEDYNKGFRDGFKAGLEEGKKLSTPQIPYPSQPSYPSLYSGCPVCLKDFSSGAWGYVCSSPKCPSRVTCGTAVRGAVGSGGTLI